MKNERTELMRLFLTRMQHCASHLETFLKEAPETENVNTLISEELRYLVHKTSGTAALFGYPNASSLAQALEYSFDKLKKTSPTTAEEKQELLITAHKLVEAIHLIEKDDMFSD